jgi:hypothetical protein
MVAIAGMIPMMPVAALGAWALGVHGRSHHVAYATILAGAYLTFGLSSVGLLCRILAKRARSWMRAALIMSVVAELVTLAAIAEFPS